MKAIEAPQNTFSEDLHRFRDKEQGAFPFIYEVLQFETSWEREPWWNRCRESGGDAVTHCSIVTNFHLQNTPEKSEA
jgi:hypothetical protein